MYRRVFRVVLAAVIGTALAVGGSAVPAAAGTAGVPQVDSISAAIDGVARTIAIARPDALFTAAAEKPVDLSRIPGAFARTVRDANQAVLAAKGLPADGTALLQFRLADPGMLPALRRGESPLVAAAQNDDNSPTVTAYDSAGRAVTLDAHRVPSRPVFVVEVDTEKALPLGLNVIRTALDRHGITKAPSVAAADGYWATQVQAVRLSDDMEPWIKGGAEIFGLAGGFGPDGKVKIDTVTMPYLDDDGTTYYPGQLIVHFSAYKYNLADFVMMEDDGDTNYQALATALVSALLTIVDGGAYAPIVDAILSAIPASWWTDDPDYVDSWYTLSTQTAGRVNGAAANGWLDIAPYWVAPV